MLCNIFVITHRRSNGFGGFITNLVTCIGNINYI